jgi:signal transduction histidine kinase
MDRNSIRSVLCSKSLAAILFMVGLGQTPALYAQDQTISQMVESSWTGRDGGPQGIQSLAQTPDGILWIGSMGGLYSFDGLEFVPFRSEAGSPSLPAKNVRFLLVSQAGDLWVFPFHGPPARIRQGTVKIFDQIEGEQLVVLGHAQQDSQGTFWAVVNERHLIRLGPDGVWHRVPDPVENGSHISVLFIDSSDTQWVIEDNLLYRKSANRAGFLATTIHVYGPAMIRESADHTLWVKGGGPSVTSGPLRGFNLQRIDGAGSPLATPRVDGEIDDIVVAQDGALWLSNPNEGIERVPPLHNSGNSLQKASALDTYRTSDGLLAASIHALFADADGNVWVGGLGGLERFRPATLVPAIAGSKPGPWFGCVASDGSVWIANENGRVVRANHNRPPVEVYRGTDITNLSCSSDEGVYVLDETGITALRNKQILHLPLLPKRSGYTDHYLFLGLMKSPEMGLIASVGGASGHGLWRYWKGDWSPLFANLDLPEVSAMLEDKQGRFYFAFSGPSGEIRRIESNIDHSFPTALGAIVGFVSTSYGIFAYGTNGIALDRGERFQRFSLQDPQLASALTGVVQSHNGDLWLNGGHGIIRIPSSEVAAAIADPTHVVSVMNLKEGNFVGPDLFILFRHSADIDPSGRLWFSTLNGVVSLDPDHLPAPARPPQLSIRGIMADDRRMNASGTFPPDTQYLDIKYFGLDLSSPRNVVYRYRLQGLDKNWQDVGNRTEAIYTHLRPGNYRFEVMASNGNHIWTKPITSATLRILPHFYERPWFQATCLLAGVVLVWFGISVRVRYVSKAVRMRAEERADERVRIARELHDTLLQGIQGLLLTFHVAAEKVPSDHVSKIALDKALTTADRIILEGRNRVSRLRSEKPTDAELKTLIEGVGANLNSIRPIEFRVERTGRPDELQGHVVDEIFCIAREAVTNAFRHSDASQVVVELDYRVKEFSMSCCDNGTGFDAEALRTSQMNGHWGLRGMKERAENIGAKLSLNSALGKGTRVCLSVPARFAYVRRSRFAAFFRRKTAA